MRDVYAVTTARSAYALYIYPVGRTRDSVVAEWSFVEWLAGGQVPVVTPVRTTGGDLTFELEAPEGERVAALAAFVPGDHLRNRYSAHAAWRYGHALASIHQRADEAGHGFGRRPITRGALVDWSRDQFAAAFPELAADVSWVSAAADVVGRALDELPRDAPAYGMIHGDAVRANAQVSDTGDVVVLDFDLCGPGWRSFDVASFLEMTRDEPYGAEAERCFVTGYETIRPRTPAEMAALPALRAACRFLAIGVPAAFADVWGRTHTTRVVDLELVALRRAVDELASIT